MQAEQPGAQIMIYQGWADLGAITENFPPSQAQLENYYDYASGDYSDWYDGYMAELQSAVPEANLQLIPVNDVLILLIADDGPLSDLNAEDLFVDTAPHGTETTYFLASMITYSAVFEEPVEDFGEVPSSVHPLVADNLDEIARIVHAEVQASLGNTPEPLPEPEPEPLPEPEPEPPFRNPSQNRSPNQSRSPNRSLRRNQKNPRTNLLLQAMLVFRSPFSRQAPMQRLWPMLISDPGQMPQVSWTNSHISKTPILSGKVAQATTLPRNSMEF